MKKIKFSLIIFLTFFMSLILFGESVSAQKNNWDLGDDGYYYYDFKDGLEHGETVIIDYDPDTEQLEYLAENNNEFKSDYNDKEFNKAVLRMHEVWMSVYLLKTYYVDLYLDNALLGSVVLSSDGIPVDTIRKINVFEIPGENLTDIKDLPLTSNDRLGTVLYLVTGLNVKVQINYNNSVYYLYRSFTSDTDMSIFDTIESYYMNINGDPQLIINHSDRPYLREILEAPEKEKPAFVPHTIWDLKTNELKTVNNYVTYAYLKQNERGVIVAYVYIDEFIIDKLLTARVSWASRYQHSFFKSIIKGKYSEWEFHEEILTSDQYLIHTNQTKDWQDLVPLWNIVRWIYKSNKTYEMPQIDSVNLDYPQSDYNITKTELTTYFRQMNDEFDSLQSNPRYKVWALALEQGRDYMGDKTEIYHNTEDKDDPRNFKIIEMSYLTNGKLYEAVGSDTDLRIILDKDIDGIANEKDRNIIRAIVITVAVVGWFYTLSKNKGFKNFETFIKITALYLVVAGLGLFIFNNYIIPDVIGTIVLRL